MYFPQTIPWGGGTRGREVERRGRRQKRFPDIIGAWGKRTKALQKETERPSRNEDEVKEGGGGGDGEKKKNAPVAPLFLRTRKKRRHE